MGIDRQRVPVAVEAGEVAAELIEVGGRHVVHVLTEITTTQRGSALPGATGNHHGKPLVWSGTNSLGTVTNAPWYARQTNLAAGVYHYRAVAVDILSLAATSAVSTVTVLSQPPTVSQTLVTNGLLVRQTGLFYQTVTVSNPTATAFAELRLWVELDTPDTCRLIHKYGGDPAL